MTPDGARVYVTTISEQPYGHFGVAVIDTATNTVVKTIPLPPLPKAIAVAPDGTRMYVANSNAVNVVDTSTNTVVAAVGPMAFPTGLAVTPGFIDIKTHSDFVLPINPKAESKVRQGVTTEIIGHCGFSVAPVLPGKAELLADYLSGGAPWLR